MLKGLLTRQAFVIIDVVLTLLVVYVLYLVGRELMGTQPLPVEGAVSPSDVVVPEFAKVGGRPDYDGIVASRLFGAAGVIEAKAPAPPPPEPPVNLVEDTQFRELKLVATSLTKPFPNAMIFDANTQQGKVYWPDDDVIPGRAKLIEIRNREVVLRNLEKTQNEILRMDPEPGTEPAPDAGAAVQAKRAPAPPPNPNSINLNREEIAQELEGLTTNISEINNTLNPRPHVDASGKTVGYTADNITSIPLARKMGLQEGDVVTQINGINIDSMEKISEVIGKFENSPSFHIKVLRQGKPQLLTYRITE